MFEPQINRDFPDLLFRQVCIVLKTVYLLSFTMYAWKAGQLFKKNFLRTFLLIINALVLKKWTKSEQKVNNFFTLFGFLFFHCPEIGLHAGITFIKTEAVTF
jgi:hypothetical protein